MKEITYYNIQIDGYDRLRRYLYPARYESYQDAKEALEKAWGEFLLEFLDNGFRTIIHEHRQETKTFGYLHQIVYAMSDGYAVIVKMAVTPCVIKML